MEYGLIGERLGHSYSKLIHEKFGFYEYELKEIPRDGLDLFMQKKEFKGINVTIPYKQDVIPYLDFVDEKARSIGAVNTVVNKDGKLYGYNTDYFGLKSLLEENDFHLKDKSVLILGTGGTSKTARAVCEDSGASLIKNVSRSAGNEAITYDEAIDLFPEIDYIINTTPAGMHPNIEGMPIELRPFKSLLGVADVIYNPFRTRIVLDAMERGINSCTGLKMLIYQAAKACEFFIGKTPDKDVLDEIYKILLISNLNPVLIGMPGSGKSTIGKMLSEKTGRQFVDTDALIVEREKREISEIFATDGEAYFRKVESEVIKEVSLMKNAIVSTGGGAILKNENVNNLKASGILYFLDRNPENLIPTSDRPLADDVEKIMKLYDERLPIYMRVADYRIDSEEGIEETVKEILELHENYQSN